MDVLQELRDNRQLGELGRMLRPPVSRQAVRRWKQVPYRYLRQVASLTGIDPAAIRPDRASLVVLWKPKWTPPRRRVPLDLRNEI